KFKNLYSKMTTDTFLSRSSLGGEIPFWISPYNPEQELEITRSIKSLKNKLETQGLVILELNLFDISIELLDEHLGEGEIFKLEHDMDKDEFKSAIQSVLDINEVFMPHLKNLIDSSNAQIYFITGVGTCFPFLRSHNVLNNLQNIAKESPTVMFFPGKYNGTSLELFGLLKDDNYYRAFNIDNYKI
ncbi:MAG: DUF1788 domain-containing protein, partial [Bacteroidota bacterium]